MSAPGERVERIELPDGRLVEVLCTAPAGAMAIVFHHGTPFSAARNPLLADAVLARGLRLVC